MDNTYMMIKFITDNTPIKKEQLAGLSLEEMINLVKRLNSYTKSNDN